MTSIRMGKDEALHLAAYLGRIVGWDERAAVRVQARGGVVGIFAPCWFISFLVFTIHTRR